MKYMVIGILSCNIYRMLSGCLQDLNNKLYYMNFHTMNDLKKCRGLEFAIPSVPLFLSCLKSQTFQVNIIYCLVYILKIYKFSKLPLKNLSKN